MYAPRVILWITGVTGFFLAFVCFATRNVAPGVACLFLALTAPGAAEVYSDRRKRNDWFSREFGTFENFRHSVDTDAVRQLRDEKGLATAVRSLRQQYPRLPLAEAARLVKEA
jgi:hypothetical protein